MRQIITLVLIAGLSSVTGAEAAGSKGFAYGTGSNSQSTYVAPHTNSNGSFTGGHYRTTPDSARSNNYGSYGNYNYHNNGIGNGYGRSVPRY